MARRISIIVPLFNEGSGVDSLVAHLKAVAPGYEVVLVDASDEPASVAVAARYAAVADANIRLLKAARPGRARQMNIGAAQAHGHTLLFLHCDTRLQPDSLARIAAAVERGAHWGRFDIALDAPGLVYRVIERMLFLRSRCRRLATGDQGIFVSATLFHRVGGFPDIALMEDIALSRLLARRHKPAIIAAPIVTSARRWRNRGPVRTILLMWRLRFLFWLGASPEWLNRMYGNER